MKAHHILDLLAVADDDRPECLRLLQGIADQAMVSEAKSELTGRLGTFSVDPLKTSNEDPMVWLTAFLQLTPTIVEWHQAHGVPTEVTRATLADVGRNIAKNRAAHSRFGLETWDWLTPHYTGMLFALGRLNFMLHPARESIDGVVGAGEWYLGIHIPESGRLTPAAVDASLAQAKTFFATCFPRSPVAIAACESWILDPYLVKAMPTNTNIAAFVQRFSKMAEPYNDASSALFFVFRTRDVSRVPSLPRDTMLQRLVLDRADRDEAWQIGSGYLRL